MQRQQLLGGLVLLALTAAVIGGTAWTAGETDAAPAMAPLEGEALSPDGRYQVLQLDEGGDGEPVPSPETVQVIDTATGEVLWEDSGDYESAALWSPDSGYLALSRRQRAYSRVTVLETETFTAWEIPLPAECRSAEYAFLYAEEWLNEQTLYFRYRDTQEGGDGLRYRCAVLMEDGRLTGGEPLRETTETLSGSYDFDHDGAPETVELATVWEPEREIAAWYELRVVAQDGAALWSAGDIALPHGGYTSIYACRLDGADYLLQYEPEMWQSWCNYAYRLFSLDETGEVIVQEGDVSFDCNFRESGHSFDTEAIADFLWELRGCLADSRLLISTEDGTLYKDGAISPAEVPAYLSSLLALDSREAMLEALRQDEAQFKWEQGIA